MQLYQKEETFSEFYLFIYLFIYFAFFKSIWNLAYFQKNMSFISEIFRKLATRINVVR